MGRKSIVKAYKVIDAGDMSATSITGTVTACTGIDNIGLLVEWSGSTPVGAITVEVQNGTSGWSALDFGSPIAVSGNTGNLNININQIPFENLRVVYTKSSGTGTLTVTLAAKVVGA
jgi:hypothetical protein